MSEQRQPFRFRLPWLTAFTPPRPTVQPQTPRPTAQPQAPRPTTEIQAPAQPTTTIPIQRPPFRPAGIAPPQPPPQAPPPRAASESRLASQPASPSRATQTRAASVPPSPSRGATETRVSSQPASPSRATSQTQVTSQTKSPSRAAIQPRAVSVPPSPSRTASQIQSALQAGPQPQSPSRFASQTTGQTSSQPSSPMRNATQLQPTARAVSQPPSPPMKLQPVTQETSQPLLIPPSSSIPREQELKPAETLQPSQEHQPMTQIKSEIVSESQYQTASETTFKSDRVAAQPTQPSGLVTADAPTPTAESEKKLKKTEEEKAVEEPVKEGKSEGGKKDAVQLVKRDASVAVDEEQMWRTLTKRLTGASNSETQTREFLSVTFKTGERKHQEQEIFERTKPLSSSKSDEILDKTVSSTHLKDRKTLSNIHQKPDIFHRERAPLHKEIKDDVLKFAHKLTLGHPKQPSDGKPVSIITLAGENRGVSMLLGSESAKKEGSVHIHRGYKTNSNGNNESTTDAEGSSKESIPRDPITKKDKATRFFINSNIQSINNSILFESSVSERDSGVQLDFSPNLAEQTKSTTQPESIETRKAEFSMTPAENLSYQPTIRRRCLRGLFMEPSDSDPDNPEKPRRHGCLYNCGENSKDKNIGVL